MKFQRREDLIKNLNQSVFYSPKLKKAYMTYVTDKELGLDIYVASEQNFEKKIHSIDASKDFHLTGLTPGFAPRLYDNHVLFAERQPRRQWHFGWSTQNTRFYRMKKSKEGCVFSPVQVNRDWWGDDGFLGRCWTGGFKSWKGIIEDGKGALSPTLAIQDDYLVTFAGVVGKVDKKTVSVYRDYFNSFLVRELKALGAEDVMEVDNV